MKLTKNTVKELGKEVVYIPYCGAAMLLADYDRIGYNSGYLGWNWDAFDMGDKIIITGYRNFTGRKANNYAAFNSEMEIAYNQWRRDNELIYEQYEIIRDDIMRRFIEQA